jgi:predicted DCC family thiol-disulfide oxidoreductase YuxK
MSKVMAANEDGKFGYKSCRGRQQSQVAALVLQLVLGVGWLPCSCRCDLDLTVSEFMYRIMIRNRLS